MFYLNNKAQRHGDKAAPSSMNCSPGHSKVCSLGSSGSLGLLVRSFLSGEVSRDGSVWLVVERGSSFDAAGVDAAVLGTDLGLLAVLPVLHQLCHAVVSQIFVEVLIVDLDHGCVDAGAEALDLAEREEPVGARLVQLDPVEVFDRLDDVACLYTQRRVPAKERLEHWILKSGE